MMDKYGNKYYSQSVPQREGRNAKREKYGKVMTKRINIEFLPRWLKDAHFPFRAY